MGNRGAPVAKVVGKINGFSENAISLHFLLYSSEVAKYQHCGANILKSKGTLVSSVHVDLPWRQAIPESGLLHLGTTCLQILEFDYNSLF